MGETTVFKTRRSLRRAGVFLTVFGLFTAAGLALLLSGIDRATGAAITACGALPVLVILLSVYTPRSRYLIESRGLLLVKGLSVRRLAFADISGARVISRSETETIITEYMAPAVDAEARLDLKGWYVSNKKYGNLTRFCTVPIVQAKTTSGHTLNITAFTAKTSGDFVILRETSGAEILLSPVEPSVFYQALSNRI